MATFSPESITEPLQLKKLLQESLQKTMADLENDRLRIRIPSLRGAMRLIPDKSFHLHPELFLQLSGETLFEFPEEELRVRPGEVCLVPRGIPHCERVRRWGGPFANLVFFVRPQEVLYHLAHERPKGRPSIWIGSQLEKINNTLPALLDEAARIAQGAGNERDSAIKGLMLAFFSLLLISLKASPQHPSPQHEPLKVMQARQAVFESLADPELSVAGLARQLQCNADYLSQLFRKSTGTTLQAYIQHHRLLRAQDLLRLSTLNIAEVSAAAGFRDPSYFTRSFHRWAGVTPGEFRKGLLMQGKV